MVYFGCLVSILMIAFAWWKKGEAPISLSSIVHLYNKYTWQGVWAIWITVVSICVGAPSVSMLVGIGKLIPVFMMACLFFTSALPLTLGNITELHNCLAIVGGVLSQVIVTMINPWFLLLWVLFLLYLSIEVDESLRGRELLLAEVICFLSISLSLMFPL